MADSGRGTERIRGDISVEREALARALADLRTDVRSSARKLPAVAGGALAAALALGAVVAAVKRRRDDDD